MAKVDDIGFLPNIIKLSQTVWELWSEQDFGFRADKYIKQTLSFLHATGMVGWCEGAVYLTSLGRPTDIGLQLGKACYPCSG